MWEIRITAGRPIPRKTSVIFYLYDLYGFFICFISVSPILNREKELFLRAAFATLIVTGTGKQTRETQDALKEEKLAWSRSGTTQECDIRTMRNGAVRRPMDARHDANGQGKRIITDQQGLLSG